MPVDLSYLTELPSEAQEDAVRKAVEQECIRAISTYLTEVADTLDANKIESLTPDALRAMASVLNQRLETNDEPAN